MALCAACGTEIGGSARFCPSCGSAVDHAGGPGRRPGSQPNPVDDAGSRRVVSVLFADVVGSTELGHELDPETLRRHVQAWFATARGVIGLHGGTVEKFVGDAVLAVFGVPRVHEDDALRAIRAAIELRDTGAGPLAIRIGIDTGEVVAGDLSSEQSFVTGTAVNMASRLQAAADPGEVLVGEATYRLARDAVEARERIAAAADGNPLFIEQLLLMLVDDGAIAREDGRWVAREPLDEIPIPPSIAALLAARLDRLPPGPRTTLEHAAVIGKVFQWGAVADLLPEADRLDVGGHLGTLVRRELVIPDPTSPAGDEAFRFRHLLVRDAAYAGIPKRTRADIHERVAAWLDGRSSADLGDTDLVIGHHLEQASELLASLGDGVRAARLAEQALDRIAPAARAALDRGDPRVAVPLLRRAVDLSPPGPGRAAGLFDLGVALALAGDVDASDAADAGAVALLAQYPDEGLDQRRRLLAAWAVVDRGEASLEMLDTIATDALEVYERLGDPAGMMRALSSAGMSRAMRGQFGAEVRLLDRAMGLAIEAGRPARAAEFAATIANRLPIGPVPVADALERCRHYALAVGDNREALATIMLSIGLLEAMSGVAPGWRRRFDEARAIIDDLGIVQPVGVADHPMLLAMAELVNGDPGRTDALLRWSCAELTRLGDRGHLATVAPLLAETLLRCDRLDEVEHWVIVGRDAAAVDDIDAQVRWRFLLALLRSAQGRHDEARPLAHAAVDLVATTEFVVLQADAQLALARVLRRAGQEAGARAAADEARRLAVAKGNVAGRQRIDAFLAT